MDELLEDLKKIWITGNEVFICGNGGSAANAIHLANDFVYGLDADGKGIKTHSLTANSSIISCLANDTGYDQIFSRQLKVLAGKGDLLMVFSGSGNSPNILKAIEFAQANGIKTCGILGFNGGKALKMLDMAIHFPVDDMQISEDLQMVVGHMIVKVLKRG